MALPNVLYVYKKSDDDGIKYFVASTDSHEQTEGIVGVYRLQESLHIRHKPQFRRPKNKTWFDK